jgi:hypothetical protein
MSLSIPEARASCGSALVDHKGKIFVLAGASNTGLAASAWTKINTQRAKNI